MDQDVSEDEVKKVGSFLLGQDKKLSEPQVKVLMELLKHEKPLLKTEISDAEIVPMIRAQGVTDVLNLPLYQKVIDTFSRVKMSHNRKRVNEILQSLNVNYKPKKTGFLSRLFGGGD